MKKTALLLLVLAICSASFAQVKIQLRSEDNAKCVSSDYRQLKAVFSFSSIEAENVDTKAGEFSWLSMPNTVFGGNEGDPQIPVINELIAVPFGANPSIRVTSYSTTDYRLSELGIGTLIPRQPSLRKDQRPEDIPFVMNEAAYQSSRGFRSEPMAVVSVVGTMRGVQLGKMTIEPVSYDPVNNTLRVFNDIEVEVSFDGADVVATEKMLLDTYSPYFDVIYKQLFNGRAVLDAYSEHPDLYTTPVKMLVVTTSTYVNSTPFQNWLNWKKQKGIDVNVQTVTSSTSSSNVRSLIQTQYNATHPTFLVIVGDESAVKNYTTWTDNSLNYSPYISDNAYASIDNDVYHDMFMSRMSVSSTTELGYLVDKILMYEKYTMPDPSYLNNVLLIAGADDTWAPRVGRPTINYAANNYFNTSNGFSNVYKYVSDTYTGCYNYLSSGVGFANYTAHGDIQMWYSPQLTNTNVNALTNTNKYFWAMGNCCLTANWGNSSTYPCFGEAMIRAQNKGAFGYIGSIPESYWWEDYYFGVGATSVYNQTPTQAQTTDGVYDMMFDDAAFNTLNAVPFAGNVAVTYAHAGNYSYSVSDEYYWRGYQCLGDGSVMPYHTVPAANNVSHDVAILAGINSLRVNADAGSYVAITVNNEIIGVAAVPANATYVDVPFTTTPVAGQTAMIVVTRNQRQPYINAEVPVINNNAPQYTITANANPTAGGTVEGAGTYYENTYCTLTAVANHGYAFDNWNDNNTLNPRTITVTGNATYTANFRVLQEHQVSYTPNQSHGSISASPTSAYVGDIVTLTATPDAGYMLDYWTVTPAVGENLTVENNQFTMPDCDVTVSATFKIEPLTVYDGTATNEYIPMYGYYFDDYTKSECIIPASELSVMNGCAITAITFYPSSVGSRNWAGSEQTVFLKEVSGTTLGGSYSGTSDATIVKQALLEMPVAGTAYTITFDAPYTYNGGNLLIGVYNDDGSNYNKVEWYGTSNLTSGVSAYGYNGSSLNSVTYNAQSFLPKTTFTYIPLTEPYINLAPNSATVLTSFTQTLTATYGNVSGTPSITYTSSDNNVATVSGSGTTATVTAVASGTATITASMTYEGTTYTATCAITVEEPSYCEPSFSNPSDDYISNFATTGGTTNINNSSTYVSGGYSDYYSSQSASIEAGGTLSCTVTPSSTQWKYGHGIWVDWNKDYVFTSDERVAYTTSTATGNWTGSVAVPADANGGDYRMRVIHYYNNTPTDACMSDTYGEAEDYKLTVINGTHYTITATANPTEGGTVSGGDTFEEGETCTLTATANTGYRFTNWTNNGNVVSTDATYTFTVTASGVYVANFTAIPQYTITIAPSDIEQGSVAFGEKGNRATLVYDFEDGTQGWTILKGTTGDSPNNWHHSTTHVSYSGGEAHDWSSFGNNGSSGFMISESYISATSSSGTAYGAVTPDNYLISPQVRLGGSISFYAGARNTSYCAEKFSVMVSTTDNTSTDSFTTIETWILSLPDAGYTSTPYTVDLSEYSGMGYIAIRHFDCNDQWILCIDDITIEEGEVNDGSVSATFYEGESCTVVASPNTDYHFVNWTEEGSTASSSATYTFTVNGDRNLVANFSQEQSVITQTTSIPAGWNWWSTPIELNNIDGWALLQEFFGSSVSLIKSQNSFSTYNNGSWTGGITSITNEEMFMLDTDEPVSFEWTGEMAQPSDHPITVVPGWNWIGFIAFDSYSLDDAFANYPALEGDMIKSQGDFAIYTNGSWNGNIATLAPGQGLMIMSNNSASITFYYPNGAKAVVENEKPNHHYTYDCHQFAHTASIMASLSTDEFELSEDLEVAAFVNGQCRGTTKLHYVASVDQYIAFLSVSGEEGETVEFKVYANGEEYAMAESLGFVTDQVVGSPAKPMLLHLGSRSEVTFYPNPAQVGETIRFEMPSKASRCQVEIFDLLGSTLRVETSTNGTIQGLGTSGVYTIKVTDENGVSHYGKLVVR